MPTAPTKPVKKTPPKKPAPAPTPEPAKAETNGQVVREIVYTDVHADRYDTNSPNGPITPQLAKDILHWMTEAERGKQASDEEKAKGNTASKPEHFVWKDDYLLLDASKYTRKGDKIILQGEKIRCFNNLDNRELDIEWSLGLAQTILTGKWAGPFTGRKTINGSTIVISETGKVESGQHQLIAVIIADQLFQANPEAYPFWDEKVKSGATYTANGETYKVTGPFIETIVVTGISEDPDVTMTHDNCKQRSPADVFYTSPLYRHLTNTNDRRNYSRMMAAAIDLLWERTDAKGYKTLPEIVGFQDRHKYLLQCVEHLFGENKGDSKPINTRVRITAGQASALCYLMGGSSEATDGDVYRNGLPPTEKDVDWSHWDKAKEFWALVHSSEQFKVVREALARLIDSSTDDPTNVGLGGRLAEKLAIIAKAWDVFVAYDPTTADMFNEADMLEGGALYLAYSDLDAKGNKLPDGKLVFNDRADFKGIDCPETTTKTLAAPEPPPPTPEQQEAIKAQLKREQALKVLALRGKVVKK